MYVGLPLTPVPEHPGNGGKSVPHASDFWGPVARGRVGPQTLRAPQTSSPPPPMGPQGSATREAPRPDG